MKKTVILSALAFAGIQANAQVSDISVTLQPTASYNWFDKNTAIEDGVTVGGRVGFGFGQGLELRGTYEKSVDLKNAVDKLDVSWVDKNDFESRNVDVERIGAELKANLPTGGHWAPYLTLGTGVQKLNVKNFDGTGVDKKSEQIYASGGLGVKVNLGDRLTLNVEGKNTVFNMNPSNALFVKNADTNKDFQSWIGDTDNTRMYNWSVLAGLQLYLGGRTDNDLSDIDRAYYRKFSGGLSDFKLSVEPGLAYINFDDKTNLRDTYLVGGQAGFDLTQYIGLRGFYYQATKEEKISTDWDKLAMYGGDLVARLNVSRGLVPYITVGGGYLNVYDGYEGENNTTVGTSSESGYFAKGGVGLTIPVTKNLELFGAANLMYTTSRGKDDYQNITSPDELKQHTMYNAGLRLQLGRTANEDEILEDRLNSRLDSRVDERTSEYKSRIKELERELKKAYEANDADKAVRIIEEKKKVETSSKSKDNSSRIRMTPQELENLVDKVIKGVDENYKKDSDNDRIERLENLLLETNYNTAITPQRQDATSQRILDELRSLGNKVDRNAMRINELQGGDKTVVITGANGSATPAAGQVVATEQTRTVDSKGNVQSVDTDRGLATGLFVYEGMSIFGGAGFADKTAGVIGIRGHYSITNSALEFRPDIYVSPSKETGFGVNANALYTFKDINNSAIVKPYLGVGVGYNSVGNTNKFGTNLIVGTSFNVLGGNLYADYTARGFVDIHQVAVGYKFSL